MESSLDWIDAELQALEAAGLRRSLRVNAGASRPEIRLDGKAVVQFSANDYLGLSTHPAVLAAAQQAIADFGSGSGSARLVSGTQAPHFKLEKALAAFKGAEAALLFSTGSMANLGLLPVLAGAGDTIYLDKLDHATIYDGANLSGATVKRFPHQDLERLEALLKEGTGRKLIAVEGIYSMDGDIAPLPGLIKLCEKYGATLIVDEAHSTGVLGAQGHGVLEHFGLAWRPNLILVGTLSKALGSLGGFVAGPAKLISLLINRSRSFIFATALPASCAASAAAALELIAKEPQRLARLWSNRALLAEGMTAQGWDIGASVSPILPVIVGPAERALSLQKQLWEAGYYAPAIRPPSVPAGACRLRLTVSSEHQPSQIVGLLKALGNA